MREKTKKYLMSGEQVDALLERLSSGILSVNAPDGFPYASPISYIWLEGRIYTHGSAEGLRAECIRADGRVSFAAFDEKRIILPKEGSSAGVSVEYESAIIKGNAVILEDISVKQKVLRAFVAKYAPSMLKYPPDDKMVSHTFIVEIKPEEITGKAYP